MKIISKKEAKELGLKRYFTGKSCKNEHMVERYIQGGCIGCAHEYTKSTVKKRKEYCESNSKHYKEYGKIYGKKYCEANSEKVKEKNNIYRRENAKRLNKYLKKYREANSEKAKEYRKNNPEKTTLYRDIRLQNMSQAIPAWYEEDKIKKLYLLRDLMKETWGFDFHVDHIIPLQHELVCGLHCLDNLQILEASKNLSKGNSFDINGEIS